MTNTEGNATARPIRHTYSPGGKAFYLVQCDECLVVLNSGHHYPEVDGEPSPHAEAIAHEHNTAKHAARLAAC